MSKSERVTAADELAAVRVVNECGELGADADAWQRHLLGWVKARTGGLLASVGAVPGDPARRLDLAGVLIDADWPSAAVRRRWERDFAGGMAAHLAAHPFMATFFRLPGAAVTRVRRELVPDREWDRSPYVNDVLRADGCDDGLMSRAAVPAVGAIFNVVATRPRAAPPVPARVGRLVEALQRELAPHLGRRLWLTTQPNLAGLPPRLRQVLDCLLDGDSEKQAALRLGLAAGTVHVHVNRVYRHFGVASRAELLAVFVRRAGRPGCPRPGPGCPQVPGRVPFPL